MIYISIFWEKSPEKTQKQWQINNSEYLLCPDCGL